MPRHFFFFFSSRRRHTRFSRDWSSDVCSSDLGALEAAGVIPPLGGEVESAAAELDALAGEIGPDRPLPENEAKQLALAIGDRFPVVWGADGLGAVAASRWKTELNENAKVPAFAAALPELDHNEVVGWSAGTGERFVLVTLRHDGAQAVRPP